MKKLFTKPELEALNLLPVDVITYSMDQIDAESLEEKSDEPGEGF